MDKATIVFRKLAAAAVQMLAQKEIKGPDMSKALPAFRGRGKKLPAPGPKYFNTPSAKNDFNRMNVGK